MKCHMASEHVHMKQACARQLSDHPHVVVAVTSTKSADQYVSFRSRASFGNMGPDVPSCSQCVGLERYTCARVRLQAKTVARSEIHGVQNQKHGSHSVHVQTLCVQLMPHVDTIAMCRLIHDVSCTLVVHLHTDLAKLDACGRCVLNLIRKVLVARHKLHRE